MSIAFNGAMGVIAKNMGITDNGIAHICAPEDIINHQH